jgi:hypothetical protein
MSSIDDLLADDVLGGEEYAKMWDDALESTDPSGLTAAELNNMVHTLVARRLVEILQDPGRCTPGMIQSALRFLKDNDITALPVPGTAQEKLKQALGSDLPFPRMAEGAG